MKFVQVGEIYASKCVLTILCGVALKSPKHESEAIAICLHVS